MNRTMPLLYRLTGALAVLAAAVAVPALPQGIGNPLRAGFDRADLNADGFLDPAELAKAFRGPDAKVPPPVYDAKGKPTPVLAEARSKYPDLIFLWVADHSGDHRVSWNEYLSYSRKHGAPFGRDQQVNAQPLQAAFPQGFGNQLFQQRQAMPYVFAPNRQYLRGYGFPAGGLALSYMRPGAGSYLPRPPRTPLEVLQAQFTAELHALGDPDPGSDKTKRRYPWLARQAQYLVSLEFPSTGGARMPTPPSFTMPRSPAVYQPSLGSYQRAQQAAARSNQRAMQNYARNYQRSVQAAVRSNQQAVHTYERNYQRAQQNYVRNCQQALRANQAMQQREMNYLRSQWRRR